MAIAISLVPPLAVVGLTLESGQPWQALGALLLFGTNVAAIIAAGTLLLLAYRIRAVAVSAGHPVGRLGPRSLMIVIGFVVVLAVPLAIGSARVLVQTNTVAGIRPVAERWAAENRWRVVGVTSTQDGVLIDALGPPPVLDAQSLRSDLDAAGFADVPVRVSLVVGGVADLGGVEGS